MQSQTSESTPRVSANLADLSALAWVADAVSKSLDTAVKALKRYRKETDAARGTDLASVDDSQLRLARQNIHQSVGALEMVGFAHAAMLLKGMETVVQQFVSQPARFTEASAKVVEQAGFGLTEYLGQVLSGRDVSPLGLFPQYKEVQTLAGADRIHPADLWPHDWRWVDVPELAGVQALDYAPAVRTRLDQDVLRVMKTGSHRAAAELSVVCQGLARGETERINKRFWSISAAFFDALAHQLVKPDLYVKRAASRILLQFTSLSKSAGVVASDRLAQDLLFFCMQAGEVDKQKATMLAAVRKAYRLSNYGPVDYERIRFGRFDPVQLNLGLKRIESLKEIWSSFSAGEVKRAKNAADQLGLVADSLGLLYPAASQLEAALRQVQSLASVSTTAPEPELAMEVATAALFLEATFEDFDIDSPLLHERTLELAERLSEVQQGQPAKPIASWMEELYRKVSDRQTMGTVVGELRANLNEAEGLLDQFFRSPTDKAALGKVPALLGQMKGVLSVLGVYQASQAVDHMRQMVEGFMIQDEDGTATLNPQQVESLGNSMGVLGLMVDMLNYQSALAKKLFVFDAESGELKAVMGRAETHDDSKLHDEGSVVVEPELFTTAARDAGGSAPMDLSALVAAPDTNLQALESLASEAALAGQNALAASVTDAVRAVEKDDAAALAQAMQQVERLAAPVVVPAYDLPPMEDIEDADLKEIFLEEAREVVANGLEALKGLESASTDEGLMTDLRRAFHTLKGSSRMVGLNEFGDAGWSLEQLLNTWRAEQRPATTEMRDLCTQALTAMGRWVDDIAQSHQGGWSSAPFRASADALRNEGKYIPLNFAASAVLSSPEVLHVDAQASEQAEHKLDIAFPAEFVQAKPAVSEHVQPESMALDLTSVLDDVAKQHTDDEGDEALLDSLILEADGPVVALSPSEDWSASAAADVVDFSLAPELLPLDSISLDLEALTEPEIPQVDALDLNAVELDVSALGVAEDALALNELPNIALSEDFGLKDEVISLANAETPELDLGFEIAPAANHEAKTAFAPTELQFDEGELPKEVGDSVPLALDLSGISLPDLELDLTGVRHSIEAADSVLEDWDDELRTAVASQEMPDLVAGDGLLDLDFKELNDLDSVAQFVPTASGVKTIGDIQISESLYNVYLSEAEDWAKQLESSLTVLADGPDEAAHELAIARAHSLAGSSSTVGFESLSNLSRSIEHALQRLQLHSAHSRVQIQTLKRGSDQVSYLLHQFAAGFLKKADEAVIAAIESVHGLPELQAPKDSMFLEDAQATGVPISELIEVLPAVQVVEPEPGVLTHDVLGATPKAVTVSEESVSKEDDFDVVDVFDADLFPIFEEEATDLFPLLASSLREWAARPNDTGPRAQVLRALHTLKGSARLAGAMRLGELAHRMESDIESLGTDDLTAATVEPMLSELDNLQAMFEKSQELAANGSAGVLEEPESTLAVEAQTASPVIAAVAPESVAAESASAKEAVPVALSEIAEPAPLVIVNDRAKNNQAVRVRSPLLDKLVNEAGEVTISRTRMETKLNQLRGSVKDITGSLDRLRRQLRDMELQTETQMQSRLQQTQSTSQNFDPLEFDRFTRVQEITRSMAESVDDISTLQRTLQRSVESVEDDLASQAGMTRSLQQNLLRTRMMEFETLSERLYRVVRQASKESGKQVKLDIAGGTIEIDRNMLERMTPAFEHLLRNSVAHGIENPDVRKAKGKDATGTITIVVSQAGNDVAVEIRDDGAGLNAAAIREKAVARGLITPQHELTAAEVGQLIFSPGFSTATHVTELAGRGVGMDVVRNEVQSLGGRIETRYAADLGSSFKLILPLTTAMTQVVMVRMGETVVGVPSSVVEIVRNLSRDEIAVCYKNGSYEYNKEKIDFFWGGALLQDSPRSMDQAEKGLPVMIFRSASQQIAVHVDEIIGNNEVVVKNLGPQLSRLPGLAAMTVLPEGDVALVYNPVALAAVYGERARRITVPLDAVISNAPAAQDNSPALIMVVDDSITVRRVTQRFLQREGFRVELANDGLQALEKLRQERPMLVLSDIEMPRMDGFDLLRNIRSDANLADLPVIMITSRIAEKHREHAQELGANHYLGKPYSEEILLTLVRAYAKGEQPEMAL